MSSAVAGASGAGSMTLMEALQELALLESRDVLSRRVREVHGRAPSAAECRQIAAHLRQGREYWRARRAPGISYVRCCSITGVSRSACAYHLSTPTRWGGSAQSIAWPASGRVGEQHRAAKGCRDSSSGDDTGRSRASSSTRDVQGFPRRSLSPSASTEVDVTGLRASDVAARERQQRPLLPIARRRSEPSQARLAIMPAERRIGEHHRGLDLADRDVPIGLQQCRLALG
jgi:hypothetical protein